MGNYLQMAKRQQVLALLDLGWSFRRIEAETGVRRETISRYHAAVAAKAANMFPGSAAGSEPPAEGTAVPPAANAAEVFPGSPATPAKPFAGSAPGRPRATAAAYRSEIIAKLDAGLSLQRIWQDLVEEFGYSASYESVKRYVRTLTPTNRDVTPES